METVNNTPKKDKWKWLRVLVYLLAPAILVSFIFSAVPAVMNKPQLTETLGLAGAGVGLLLGLLVGLKKKFA